MAPVTKKVMKVQKNASSDKSSVSAKKRPASSLTKNKLDNLEADPSTVGLSLDEKIKQFEKKPQDINGWLARLSKQEREACWKRFEYDRKSVPGAQEGYLQAACGKRSKEVKLDLLKAFLANHCSCKGQAMQQAFMAHGITVGVKSKESWRPFVYMSQYYGVAELFRRVRDGTILARKDGSEWEFKLVETTSYRDEHDRGGFKATASGKLSEDKFAELQGISSKALAMDSGGTMDKGLFAFLQSKASSSKPKAIEDQTNDDDDAADAECDPDVVAAEKLSDLGTVGKKAKERVTSAVALLQKVIKDTTDEDMKCALNFHLKALKKAETSNVKLEDVKSKLINAMQCIKKAKKMSST